MNFHIVKAVRKALKGQSGLLQEGKAHRSEDRQSAAKVVGEANECDENEDGHRDRTPLPHRSRKTQRLLRISVSVLTGLYSERREIRRR